MPPASDRPGQGWDYKIPSDVLMNDGHLYFGWPAQEIAKSPQARRFISVKMRTVFPHAYHGPQTELPKDLTAEDLATIGMLYMIETGGCGQRVLSCSSCHAQDLNNSWSTARWGRVGRHCTTLRPSCSHRLRGIEAGDRRNAERPIDCLSPRAYRRSP